MVTNFVELAKTKSKSGPWGRAQASIARTVTNKGTKFTKRRAVHRRKRRKRSADEKERQGRMVHKLHHVLQQSVTRMFLYYNWGGDSQSQNEVCKKFNIPLSHSVDVSHYKVIHSSKTKHAVCIQDDNNDEITFICGKIDDTQAHSVMKGRSGYNDIRESINLLKKSKKNQDRGEDTSGTNTSYKLVGHRKDPLSNVNREYTFLPDTDKSNIDILHEIYSGLAYKMEKCARRLGNALYETGMYAFIQEQTGIPAVAIEPSKINNSTIKKTTKMANQEITNIPKTKPNSQSGLGTALAIGQNYWSKAHRDRDFYFSTLSVLSESTHDTGKVLYYYFFPDYEIAIPMRTGDILLFNPNITHSCSNPSTENAYIFSSYVAKQTVLVEEATRMRKSDELVNHVVEKVYASMKNVYATMK